MKKTVSLLLSLCLVLLCGCSRLPGRDDDTYRIITSFYPIYIFTLNLTDGIPGVEVSVMSEQNTGCLHDYRLMSADMKKLSDADMFVINGAGMETFLDKVTEQLPSLCVVDSSQGIHLYGGEPSEHTGEDEDAHEGEGHSHSANSHIWMSVSNARTQVENIYSALLSALPIEQEQLLKNYENYSSRLGELSDELSASLSGLTLPIVTFHEAYDYLGRDYSLNIIASVESDDGGEPTAKQLAHLVSEIRENHVTALFTEPDYKGSAAEILSAETGAEIFVLNPVTSGEAVLTAYEDIMRENEKTILRCAKGQA